MRWLNWLEESTGVPLPSPPLGFALPNAVATLPADPAMVERAAPSSAEGLPCTPPTPPGVLLVVPPVATATSLPVPPGTLEVTVGLPLTPGAPAGVLLRGSLEAPNSDRSTGGVPIAGARAFYISAASLAHFEYHTPSPCPL